MATTIHGKVRPQVMGISFIFFFLLLSASSMAADCKGKSSWPELVGFYGRFAPPIIRFQNPLVTDVDVVLQGTLVTMDFRCDRVRVWVNTKGIIYKPPTIG
ncbi:unnamed protein product [Victoria cruziana]